MSKSKQLVEELKSRALQLEQAARKLRGMATVIQEAAQSFENFNAAFESLNLTFSLDDIRAGKVTAEMVEQMLEEDYDITSRDIGSLD